jgi:sporulation protein YlmC with PRC-barrel domain
MRLSAANDQPVVDTSDATTVGTVKRVVIDPKDQRIAAIVVAGSDKGSLVGWEDMAGFGPDAVTVTSTSAVRLPQSEREEATVDGGLDALGKTVYDDAGDRLGDLDDVEFDTDSGKVQSLIIDGVDEPVDGDRLLGVGSHCVVVRAATV